MKVKHCIQIGAFLVLLVYISVVLYSEDEEFDELIRKNVFLKMSIQKEQERSREYHFYLK
jgi:hypothetical protein